MAESVVAQQPQRFYCHKCNVEIENVSSVSLCVGSTDFIKHSVFVQFFLFVILSMQWKYDCDKIFIESSIETYLIDFYFHSFVVFFRNIHVHCVQAVSLKSYHQMGHMIEVATQVTMKMLKFLVNLKGTG